MPFFDFLCGACAHEFEELVFGDERPACPACRASDVARRPAAFAVGRPAARPAATPVAGPGCGACGDPRGPGACQRG